MSVRRSGARLTAADIEELIPVAGVGLSRKHGATAESELALSASSFGRPCSSGSSSKRIFTPSLNADDRLRNLNSVFTQRLRAVENNRLRIQEENEKRNYLSAKSVGARKRTAILGVSSSATTGRRPAGGRPLSATTPSTKRPLSASTPAVTAAASSSQVRRPIRGAPSRTSGNATTNGAAAVWSPVDELLLASEMGTVQKMQPPLVPLKAQALQPHQATTTVAVGGDGSTPRAPATSTRADVKKDFETTTTPTATAHPPSIGESGNDHTAASSAADSGGGSGDNVQGLGEFAPLKIPTAPKRPTTAPIKRRKTSEDASAPPPPAAEVKNRETTNLHHAGNEDASGDVPQSSGKAGPGPKHPVPSRPSTAPPKRPEEGKDDEEGDDATGETAGTARITRYKGGDDGASPPSPRGSTSTSANPNAFFGSFQYGSIRGFLHEKMKQRFGSYSANVEEHIQRINDEVGHRSPRDIGTASSSGAKESPRIPSPREYQETLRLEDDEAHGVYTVESILWRKGKKGKQQRPKSASVAGRGASTATTSTTNSYAPAGGVQQERLLQPPPHYPKVRPRSAKVRPT